jgi:RNA polymerase sigma-70 factor (ECF subfamily)
MTTQPFSVLSVVTNARTETERLRKDLIAFARRRGGAAEDAEDIVQEAFGRFHRAGRALDAPDARPLLHVIVRNLLHDRRRARRDHGGRRLTAEEAELRLVDEAPTPDRTVGARQELAAVSHAIGALPPRCRDAFVMSRFEDLTYDQIADRLGVSVSAVEKHVTEALRRLKPVRSMAA